MHYQSKHAVAKTTKIKHRIAGVGIASAATIVGGIAVASSASADSVWDRVAACESGGNWSINTGNGYQGGLQFSGSTWRAYGGGKYASSASQASKSQQIAIAQRTLKGQGPGAWPVCSRKAGLTSSNGGANTYTASRSSNRTAVPQKSYQAPKRTYNAPQKTYTAPQRSYTAPQRSYTAPRQVTTTRTYSAPQQTRSYSSTGNGARITVRPGNTLGKLAASYNVQGGWQALYAANRGTVNNPNLIFVGQVLRLP